MYRLNIVKMEPNPKYDEAVEKETARNRYGYATSAISESPWNQLRSLEVDLTDEEFAAIKKAVLEVM